MPAVGEQDRIVKDANHAQATYLRRKAIERDISNQLSSALINEVLGQTRIDARVTKCCADNTGTVKNLAASYEAFKNMILPYEEKPKQASGYQTQRE